AARIRRRAQGGWRAGRTLPGDQRCFDSTLQKRGGGGSMVRPEGNRTVVLPRDGGYGQRSEDPTGRGGGGMGQTFRPGSGSGHHSYAAHARQNGQVLGAGGEIPRNARPGVYRHHGAQAASAGTMPRPGNAGDAGAQARESRLDGKLFVTAGGARALSGAVWARVTGYPRALIRPF